MNFGEQDKDSNFIFPTLFWQRKDREERNAICKGCDMNEEEKDKGENETYGSLVRNSPPKKNERACHVKGHVQS